MVLNSGTAQAELWACRTLQAEPQNFLQGTPILVQKLAGLCNLQNPLHNPLNLHNPLHNPLQNLQMFCKNSAASCRLIVQLLHLHNSGRPTIADCLYVCVQAQHGRAGSWGSSASASDLPALAPSGALSNAPPPSAAASGQLPEGVPASRLLATIHSGIPSTDDDGMPEV